MSEPAPRPLGPVDATLLVMGGIVGVGIFFTPAQVAALAPHPAAVLALWGAGAVLALFGALTFAELGSNLPRTGGWFVYLKEAFGPFPAFLFAWVILLVVTTGATAAVADFLGTTVAGLVPAVGAPGSPGAVGVSALAIVGLVAVCLGGVKLGATVQNLCMVTKLVALAALVAAGLALVGGAAPPPPEAAPAAPEGGWFAAAMGAMLAVLFSYGGWQQLTYLAPQVRDAERVVPRALVVGVLGVGIVYVLVNAAYLRAFGVEGLATTPAFPGLLAERAFGAGGRAAVDAALAVSAIGILAVIVLVSPTLYVAMAREKLFFEPFGRLHPATGAPVLGLLAHGALSLGYLGWTHADLVLGPPPEGAEPSFDLEVLTGSVVFAEWFFHALVAAALIRLRRVRVGHRVLGRSALVRLAPWVYLACATLVVAGNVATQPGPRTGVGLAALATGAVAYVVWRKWRPLDRGAG